MVANSGIQLRHRAWESCHRQGRWEEMNETSEFGRRKSDFQHLEGNLMSEVEKVRSN